MIKVDQYQLIRELYVVNEYTCAAGSSAIICFELFL